jgi:hypothetical protein
MIVGYITVHSVIRVSSSLHGLHSTQQMLQRRSGMLQLCCSVLAASLLQLCACLVHNVSSVQQSYAHHCDSNHSQLHAVSTTAARHCKNQSLYVVKAAKPHTLNQHKLDTTSQVADNSPGLKWMNLGPSMEQFGHTMGAQTRLDVEARHLGIFNRNFGSWPECDFPVALGCSQDVLVETFEQGFLMSDYLRRYSAEDRRAASAAGRTVDADDELQVSHVRCAH